MPVNGNHWQTCQGVGKPPLDWPTHSVATCPICKAQRPVEIDVIAGRYIMDFHTVKVIDA